MFKIQVRGGSVQQVSDEVAAATLCREQWGVDARFMVCRGCRVGETLETYWVDIVGSDAVDWTVTGPPGWVPSKELWQRTPSAWPELDAVTGGKGGR